jgi:hypothetical protein
MLNCMDGGLNYVKFYGGWLELYCSFRVASEFWRICGKTWGRSLLNIKHVLSPYDC